MRFTILAFFFMASLSLGAQVDSLTTFQVGVGGGQYFSSVNFIFQPRRAENYQLLPGAQFGAGIRYFNRRSAGFIAELNYSSSGWSEEIIELVDTDTLIENYNRELAFVELQVLTQFAIGRKRFRPFLEGGPYLGFPVKDKEVLPPNLAVPTGEYYFGNEPASRLDYGVTVGLGVYVDLGPVGLQLGGRYLAGVRDIFKPGANGVSSSRRQSIGWRCNVWFNLSDK